MVTTAQNHQPSKAVFLDRDGVLNISDVNDGKPYAPRRVEDFILYEGVIDAVEQLKAAGYLVIVVTNQPDVGNGIVKKEVVEEMHAQLMASMPINNIYVCFHAQLDGCDCRKPKPGMLVQSAKEYGIDLSKSFIVGDRCSDIEAGKAAECKTIFIDRHYKEPAPKLFDNSCESLIEAVDIILNQNVMNKTNGGKHECCK